MTFNESNYNTKPNINDASRISITNILVKVREELKSKYYMGEYLQRLRSDSEAEQLKDFINNNPHKFSALQVPQHDTSIKVDYIKSNLGIGYFFYLVCKCERRVLHLYQAYPNQPLGCRLCHRLRYKKPPSRQQLITRMLKNPQLFVSYLSSMPRQYEVAVEAIQKLNKVLDRQTG